MLHNGIEVGGLNVDDQYVPEVFFSETRAAQQDEFAREMAALRLGIGVAEEDKLDKPLADVNFLRKLDAAFLTDLGFTYRDLLKVLSTLINWVGGALRVKGTRLHVPISQRGVCRCGRLRLARLLAGGQPLVNRRVQVQPAGLLRERLAEIARPRVRRR